jgi:hypothetical protein
MNNVNAQWARRNRIFATILRDAYARTDALGHSLGPVILDEADPDSASARNAKLDVYEITHECARCGRWLVVSGPSTHGGHGCIEGRASVERCRS